MDFEKGDCIINIYKLKSLILDKSYEDAIKSEDDSNTVANLLNMMAVISFINEIGDFPEGK